MTKPEFVYVTYIATTPEKVFHAIVDTDIAQKYWMGAPGSLARANYSDWKPGSRWEHRRVDESQSVDVVGKVVESEPPRRLVMTWARPAEADDDTKHSRVTFDIEQQEPGTVRLTVTHENFEHDPKMLASISGGWPRVLSNLKTMLEAGRFPL
ncbi:MAG TPA: SRPBCC family protein [Gemmatimonadaceae bacterium]|jgi:uncharacterized protein YndB with AHSA1/START domain